MTATGFLDDEAVTVELADGGHLQKFEGPYGEEKSWSADSNGTVTASLTVPREICCAGGKLDVIVTSVKRHTRGASGQAIFTITN
ncbi:hypothetical protein ACI2L1_14070 [Streptomyces sp. NPDC019531]|uniref:hypothetical protein n=1 Tax=Streptomyces sp. NPDC019531 TaxID=3365062 RepID=UPI00384E5AA6